jgi:hypothetical protein
MARRASRRHPHHGHPHAEDGRARPFPIRARTAPRRSGHPHHRVRNDRRRGGGDPVRRVRLHLEALRRGGTPARRGERRPYRIRHSEGGYRRRGNGRMVRHGGALSCLAGDPQSGREGGCFPALGHDHGGHGNGERARCTGDPPDQQEPGGAVHQDQRRGDPASPVGGGSVRLRKGSVHRGGHLEAGAVRAGAWGNLLSG